ncbi:uncharacterized protein LOC116005658 [Ipomoea triloba]|uniref:uncharacterized protein LOC116005658 n=1 Tax=Ipomoea triloba TaxID=35885 RepID=UPI00125CDDEE|nr:uncharacterized protein LOC116005658 [Ipomoea triloba]
MTAWNGFTDQIGGSLVCLVECYLRLNNAQKIIELAARIWAIWTARNDALWNAKVWNDVSLKNFIVNCVSTWLESYLSTNLSLHGTPIHEVAVWSPPPLGMVKCNIDASLLHDNVGFGAVIRDHFGHFVAAFSGLLPCAKDPYLAETMAVKEALTWIKNRGYNNIIVESDCQSFCLNFNSACNDFYYVGLLIKQCRYIASGIGNISVRHVNRSANHVAHVLARATGSSSVLGVWDFAPPDCISSFFRDLI